jgi:DNA-binding CsgD family transcriptional regulator
MRNRRYKAIATLPRSGAETSKDSSISGGLLTLIGEIYDATLDLSRWPGVLNTFAGMTRSDGVMLVIEEPRADTRAVASPVTDEATPVDGRHRSSAVWVSDGMSDVNPAQQHRVLHGRRRNATRSRDHAEPGGTFTTLCVNVLSDARASAVVAGWRALDDSESVETKTVLEPVLPHLRRAVDIMLRTKTLRQRHDSATASLDRVPQPVILLDSNRCVVFANRAAVRILRRRDGLAVEGNRLRATPVGGHDVLHELCEDCRRMPVASTRSERFLFVERPSLKEPLEIVAVPLTAMNTLGIADERASLALFIVDPEGSPEVEEQTLCELFGLTAAEARVASALAGGLTLAETSLELRISVTTARWHLRHVFAKTSTSRQPELVSVLLRGVAALERS